MANQVVLQLLPSARNARNSEGAFVTLKSGRVLYIYTKYGRDSADHGHAVLASRYSDDGGRSWSTRDKVEVPQEGDTNVMSVSLLRLQDGRIGMLNLRKDGGLSGTCMPWWRVSDDEARTWSKPVSIIPPPGYYVVNNDRVIQTSRGRLIVPCGLHRFRAKSWFTQPGEKQDMFLASGALILYYFSDNGVDWFESESTAYVQFPNGHGLQEPGVVELKDGRLWSWCRAGAFGIEGSHGYQWELFSDDHGMHWDAPRASQFRSPCSPMSVKRIPGRGDLLAVWNDHSGHFRTPKARKESWGRTPLVSAISKDEGKTWGHRLLLEKSPSQGFCYIAVHFIDDHALLAYCAGGMHRSVPGSKMVLDTVRIRRIAIRDLYA